MFTRSIVVPTVIDHPAFELSRVSELELHSMVRAEEDMMVIYNQIIELEDQFKMLLKAKQTSEYHQQLELEKDRRVINESRSNIQVLLGQLSLCTNEAQHITNENLATLELCKKKSLELDQLKNKNLVLQKNNLQQFKDRDKLMSSIEREKVIKAGLETQWAQLKAILEDNLSKLKVLQGEQEILERENIQLQRLRVVAQNDYNSLQKQKLEREVSSEKTTIALNEAIKQREEAKMMLADLQNQNSLIEGQHARLLQKLQKEIELTSKVEMKVKASLKSLALAEREFQQVYNVNNSLRQQNNQLSKRNLEMNESVKKQIKEIELYELQNQDLKRQIDVFLVCEEEARKILNHRAPLEMLMGNSSAQLNLSRNVIKNYR